MQSETTTHKLTLVTSHPILKLIALTSEDADVYYKLVDTNRAHLTQNGDYSDLKEASLESVAH